LPIFLNGLMLGSVEIREQSASGLGELINLTSESALKPFVIQITGPLIRIVGDRFPWQVKAAILQTLNLLVVKGGLMLKPFIPQLQTTFIRALQDLNRGVRTQAVTALSSLMAFNTKVDPLITELLNGLSNSSGDIQETMLLALQSVLLKTGKTVSSELLSKIGNTLIILMGGDDDSSRSLVAKSIGAYSKFLSESQLISLLDNLLLDNSSWQVRSGSCLALKSILHHNPNLLSFREKEINFVLLKCCSDSKAQVRQSSVEALGKVILIDFIAESDHVLKILTPLSELMSDSANDVKLSALKIIKKFSKKFPSVIEKHLNVVVPLLVERIKDRSNFPVKLASERALMHVLQIHTKPETLKLYTQGLDQAAARTLVDYSQKVLSKLTKDSASEDSEEEII